MADVPNDLVLRQIKLKMKSHGKLYNAQICSEMSACLADLIDQKFSDLGSKRVHLVIRHVLDVTCFIYRIKDHFNFVFQGVRAKAPP